MATFTKISILVLALAIVACCAEPPRYRQVRKFQQQKQRPLRLQPVRKFAKQQEPVTPYPNAEELKPEVAFEEGNTPDEVYGPPDETYGPPEADQTPADQLPTEDAPEDFAPNTDAEEFQPSEIEETQPETEPEQPSRLTSRRKVVKKIAAPSRLIQKKKKSQKSQRLVVAPAVSAPLVDAAAVPVSALPFSSPFSAVPQQYFVVNQQPFAYSAQYQVW